MSRTTYILAVAFVLVGGFTLWSMFASDPELQNTTLITETTTETTSVEDTKTLEALINMRNIRLDSRLFEDPAFIALINTERQIIPEPVGRQNPFLPIGAEPQPQVQPQGGAAGAGNPQEAIEFEE